MSRRTLIYGIGINDANYAVKPIIDGKRVVCPFYRVWQNMLERCYDAKVQARHPTYMGCTVAPEWHRFSTFEKWMAAQPWQGRELDKDLLRPGNKVYGPDFCRFVPQRVNKVLNDSAAIRGEYPVGVYWLKHSKRFVAKGRGTGGDQLHLGTFNTAAEAFHFYLRFKSLVVFAMVKRMMNDAYDSEIGEALFHRCLTMFDQYDAFVQAGEVIATSKGRANT